ncbi:unnamed protein product [Meganyctiphanes norvegica]|uniref:Uncharacterized protein n=1 Tax=Meganyctiphanes norvegica TaxID=48144 RepID=A0AAV2RJY3_MEGNR
MAIPLRREVLEPMESDKPGADLKDLVLSRLLILLEEGDVADLPGDIKKSLKKSVAVFVAQYVKRYKAAENLEDFLRKEEEWLDTSLWLDVVAKRYFKSDDFDESDSDQNNPPSGQDDIDENEFNSGEENTGSLDPKVDVLDLQGDLDIKLENDSDGDIMSKKRKKVKQSVSDYISNKYETSIYKEDSGSDLDDSSYVPSRRGRGRPRGSRSRGRPPRLPPGQRPKLRHETLLERHIKMENDFENATNDLMNTYTTNELLCAADKSSLNDCSPEVRQVIKLAIEALKSPERAKEVVKCQEDTIPYTNEEAVLLNVENNLPSPLYHELRITAKKKHADIYPTYREVSLSKFACYPEGMQLSHNVSEVPLQNLLNHSAERILQLQKHELVKLKPNSKDRYKLILTVKWGYDGSSGSSEWRHQYVGGEALKDTNETDLFCTSLVPLRLKCSTDIVWENPTPSSVRFCRPLSLQYGKETPELAYEAQVRVERQIRELKPYSTCVRIGDGKKDPVHWRKKLKVEVAEEAVGRFIDDQKAKANIACYVDIFFNVQQALIDPSIASPITGSNAALDCHLCASKPNPFDQAQLNAAALRPPRPVNPESFKYMLSPLHAWVSCFECLTHLSCFLPQDSWTAGADINMRVSQRKADIQRGFRKQLGLIIDKPRSGCAVSVNDANTAIKAFHSEAAFARICGLDQGLIHRFKVILTTLSCDYEIDYEEFGQYCQTTAELFNALYHWFHVPLAVHKILHHGESMASEVILPIGMMSEEAQKARNKGYQSVFLKQANKKQELSLTDVMKHLMITGDPSLSSKSIDMRKSRENWKLLGDVITLLKDSKSLLIKAEKVYDDLDEGVDESANVPENAGRDVLDLSFDTSDPHGVVHTDDPAFAVPSSNIGTAYHHPNVSDPRFQSHSSAEVAYDPNLTHIAFSIVPNISM